MGLRTIFARNLKARRLEQGLSQEELAQEAGLDRSYVSLLENERYSVSLDTLEKLAAVLKIEPVELLRTS
jgi:transcriptional regulator with XRE-family HTH domain